jgi:hypothetical protein
MCKIIRTFSINFSLCYLLLIYFIAAQLPEAAVACSQTRHCVPTCLRRLLSIAEKFVASLSIVHATAPGSSSLSTPTLPLLLLLPLWLCCESA